MSPGFASEGIVTSKETITPLPPQLFWQAVVIKKPAQSPVKLAVSALMLTISRSAEAEPFSKLIAPVLAFLSIASLES